MLRKGYDNLNKSPTMKERRKWKAKRGERSDQIYLDLEDCML